MTNLNPTNHNEYVTRNSDPSNPSLSDNLPLHSQQAQEFLYNRLPYRDDTPEYASYMFPNYCQQGAPTVVTTSQPYQYSHYKVEEAQPPYPNNTTSTTGNKRKLPPSMNNSVGSNKKINMSDNVMTSGSPHNGSNIGGNVTSMNNPNLMHNNNGSGSNNNNSSSNINNNNSSNNNNPKVSPFLSSPPPPLHSNINHSNSNNNNIIIINTNVKNNKRASHNATEQRRRDKIRDKMNELKAVVPICDSDRKSQVLQKSIEYIIFLKEQYNDLLKRSKSLQDEYQKIGGKNDFLGFHITQPATSIGGKDPLLDHPHHHHQHHQGIDNLDL